MAVCTWRREQHAALECACWRRPREHSAGVVCEAGAARRTAAVRLVGRIELQHEIKLTEQRTVHVPPSKLQAFPKGVSSDDDATGWGVRSIAPIRKGQVVGELGGLKLYLRPQLKPEVYRQAEWTVLRPAVMMADEGDKGKRTYNVHLILRRKHAYCTSRHAPKLTEDSEMETARRSDGLRLSNRARRRHE